MRRFCQLSGRTNNIPHPGAETQFKDVGVNSRKVGTDLKDNTLIPPYMDDHDCLGQTTAPLRAKGKNNFKYLQDLFAVLFVL